MLSGYLSVVVVLATAARQRTLEFDEVYEQVREPVARFALRMLGDPEEAADLAQETALAIWKGLGNFEGRSKVTTWALGIVANLAKKRLRKKKREPRATEPDRVAEVAGVTGDRAGAVLEAREEAERVRAALADLPETQRSVFLLVTDTSLSYGEIASSLGISLSNVKVSMFRARKALLKQLEEAA